MYIVFDLQPGDTFVEVMDYLVSKNLTFSVTDNLGKLHKEKVPQKDGQTQTILAHTPLKPRSIEDKSSKPPIEPKSAQNRKRTAPKPVNEKATDDQVMQLVATIKQACPGDIEEKVSTDSLDHEVEAVSAKKIAKTEQDTDSCSDSNDLEHCLPECSSDDGPKEPTNTRSYRTRRGTCQLCEQTISIVSLNPKYHVLCHLGLKEWKCALCNTMHRRPNLAKDHYQKKHPEAEFQPFVYSLSDEEKQRLDTALLRCFPHRQSKTITRIEIS